ncbi:MAG: aldehyde dehydrogenase family protein [Thaumarchaeota archaeon]|nr:aldehyde dehydrogenase family protein [Nitrososphaerota archaeon]
MVKAIVGGALLGSDRMIPVRNPADGGTIGEIPDLKRDDIRSAIDSADQALAALQSLTVAARSRLLLKVAAAIREHAEALASTMTDEIGRPIKSSRGEMMRTAVIFELAASEVKGAFEGQFIPLEAYEFPAGNDKRIAFVKRDPVGVVASITPFNFPASSFAHKVAPALALGNTVVHKPSVHAPLTQLMIAQMILDAGFPSGSVNVVTGNSGMIGAEIVENPKVALVSFTGSADVGLDLAGKAVSRGKKVIMELGGSDAQIVLDDADLQKASAAAVLGRFDYAGQFCNATKRLLVSKEVSAEFSDNLLGRLKRMMVGDPRLEETEIGPLISDNAVKQMQEFFDDAKAEGAEVVYQGSTPSKGYFFPPTVMKLSKPMRITSEEVFGPLVPIIEVATEDEAIQLTNSSPYGLDASIFTKDFGRAYRLASRLKVGSVMINDTTRLRWDNLPFGGPKKSGIGREGIRNTMLEMTEPKLIVCNVG